MVKGEFTWKDPNKVKYLLFFDSGTRVGTMRRIIAGNDQEAQEKAKAFLLEARKRRDWLESNQSTEEEIGKVDVSLFRLSEVWKSSDALPDR
ncbi:MAG: hypothetical protein AAB509_02425 [Patescibacteria group bacterium]